MKKPMYVYSESNTNSTKFLNILNERIIPEPQDYLGLNTPEIKITDSFISLPPADIKDYHLKLGTSGNIFVRLVKPINTKEKLPVIFYIHGGGWTAGSFISHDRLIRQLANYTNSAVIFPSYNLSPEIEFHSAINECYETIKYFYTRADEFNIKMNRIAIAGDCAGANMATILTILSKENHGPRIAFQTLFYPITKSTNKNKDITDYLRAHRLSKQEIECRKEMYFEKPDILTDNFASPFMAKNKSIKGLPPALLITTPNNNCSKKRSSPNTGLDIIGIKYKGCTHGFMVIKGVQEPPPAKTATMQACKVLKAVLHGGL